MSLTETYEGSYNHFAADAIADARSEFIRRTYLHLAAAMLVFVGLTGLFLGIEPVRNVLAVTIGQYWFVSIIAFMGVSWLANWWAHSQVSTTLQYVGLATYVLAVALLFVPLLTQASMFYPDVIPAAALLTAIVFGGLTVVVMITGADFSFLRNVLVVGSLAVLGTIGCSLLFGFSLGIVFVSAALALVCGYILYTTSNVLHHYRTDQHVAASLALFACVAELFWWMIRLLSFFSDD
ncbi:Bax inhibitor-1/YccA family protein [Stratiformator vulcanicus]|uniref:Inhibitor of apoptosis-promoting Bax1 n=1 Tax=Stratiformator vulcanicus TaxID=2527980 RepID=A0A517R344_9PLAN|nr:Bax inhibitor-1 family protein [Stratiformator vulcanicus]QDT38310.1 Inhibitor of apoptosis-promoting Bax1 [Stratiformator vulcanicus]